MRKPNSTSHHEQIQTQKPTQPRFTWPPASYRVGEIALSLLSARAKWMTCVSGPNMWFGPARVDYVNDVLWLHPFDDEYPADDWLDRESYLKDLHQLPPWKGTTWTFQEYDSCTGRLINCATGNTIEDCRLYIAKGDEVLVRLAERDPWGAEKSLAHRLFH